MLKVFSCASGCEGGPAAAGSAAEWRRGRPRSPAFGSLFRRDKPQKFLVQSVRCQERRRQKRNGRGAGSSASRTARFLRGPSQCGASKLQPSPAAASKTTNRSCAARICSPGGTAGYISRSLPAGVQRLAADLHIATVPTCLSSLLVCSVSETQTFRFSSQAR